ncbi:MAG: HD domain-containing protein [Clostridia bacterium]|nr:HD domain-containing protein [Clostridia bacterium]
MEIDILKAKKAFNEYVKNYNVEDSKVQLKIKHTYKVVENSEKIAKRLKLTEEEQKLAQLIALLHDIGRFEQLRKYNTFVDKMSVNHAVQGVEVLFKENRIRDFIETDKYDETIKKAILNHNRPEIEDGLDEKTKLQAQIIRDSDKLDIFRVILEVKPEDSMTIKTEDIENEQVTDEIYNQFMNKEKIDYSKIKTNMDIMFSWFAYSYDFNFKESKQYIIENNYMDRITKIIRYKNKETQKRIEEGREKAKEYLEQ